MKVYYKKSSDNMATWSEATRLNKAGRNYYYVKLNVTSNSIIYAVYVQDNVSSAAFIYGDTVANLKVTQRAYIFEADDGANVNPPDMAAETLPFRIKGERLNARFQIDNQTGI
jgi:hypothetical protein